MISHFSTYHLKRHFIKGILIKINSLKDSESLFSKMAPTIKEIFGMVRLRTTLHLLYFQMEVTIKEKLKILQWTGKDFLIIKMFIQLNVYGKTELLKEKLTKDAINKMLVIKEAMYLDSSKVQVLIYGITEIANILDSFVMDWCMIKMEK